jgi:small-conductance mechanosensitive channel
LTNHRQFARIHTKEKHMKNTLKTKLLLTYITGLSLLHLGMAETDSAESARIRWATTELAEAKQSLTACTNEVDRILNERRIDLAQKALENYRLQAELDQKEQLLSLARQRSADFVLRKAIGAIESDETTPKDAAATHNAEIRRLKERRANEETRLAQISGTPDTAIAALAQSEARLVNIDAEIMANMLERDTEEIASRLAREAKRVDANFSVAEQEIRITLGMLLDSRRAIRRSAERLEEYTVLQSELQDQSRDTCAAVDITRSRLAQLKQEVDILTHRSRVEKQSSQGGAGDSEKMRSVWKKLFGSGTDAEKQLKQMIGDVEDEIPPLEKRIAYLERQCASIRNSLRLTEQGRDLFTAEANHLTNRFVVERANYTRRILIPISAISLVVGLYLVLSFLVFPFLLKQHNLFIARRLGSYAAILVVFVVLITFFLEDLRAIATIMGIVGAAIVIALQDMCSAFAGWFVIIASRKLRVGDRVEINGHRGEILDIQMLRTTLVELNNWLDVDEATGRTLIIPNNFIFKSEVFNYSHIHPHIWGKVDITVTFESSPQKAYELLFKVLEEKTRSAYIAAAKGGKLMAKHYGVSRGIYEPHIHTVIADSGICYSLFYVAHYRRFTVMRDKIMSGVVEAVSQTPDVEFAYPTERRVRTGTTTADSAPPPALETPTQEAAI